MKISKQDCAFLLETATAAYLIVSSCVSREMVQNVLIPVVLKAGFSFFRMINVFPALYSVMFQPF